MSFGECTITLEDVAILLGLKISGAPITGYASMDWGALVQRLLGMTPPEAMLVGGRLRMRWIDQHFSDVSEHIHSQEHLERYTRAFILRMIGRYLLTDHSSSFVSLKYLSFLEDLDVCGQMSWGSCVLANMYMELCVAMNYDHKEIAGSVWCPSKKGGSNESQENSSVCDDENYFLSGRKFQLNHGSVNCKGKGKRGVKYGGSRSENGGGNEVGSKARGSVKGDSEGGPSSFGGGDGGTKGGGSVSGADSPGRGGSVGGLTSYGGSGSVEVDSEGGPPGFGGGGGGGTKGVRSESVGSLAGKGSVARFQSYGNGGNVVVDSEELPPGFGGGGRTNGGGSVNSAGSPGGGGSVRMDSEGGPPGFGGGGTKGVASTESVGSLAKKGSVARFQSYGNGGNAVVDSEELPPDIYIYI
ncbi:loricrin-like [Cajanus cajan]|uniref:loricrin-like n=1 Tax=Cajanus cajan TaxID=3821 RepID=UPI00098DD24C|nr:loricrin-like [Cajanus cajan]